jgi:hypothetical protein
VSITDDNSDARDGAGGSAGQPDDSALDRYIDDVMDPAERTGFEEVMLRDVAVAARVQFARSTDERLRGAYAYPENVSSVAENITLRLPEERNITIGGRPVVVVRDPSAKPRVTEMSEAEKPRSHGRRNALFAIAASLAVAATYSLWPREEIRLVSPDEIYRRLVMSGWTPSFTCENDEQFVIAVKKRLGVGVLIPLATTGVTLNGWGYSEGYTGTPIGNTTMFLLTEVEGKPVLVLMERASRDRKVELSDAGKNALHLFRRKVGGVVLYEVTPWPTQRVIPAAIEK